MILAREDTSRGHPKSDSLITLFPYVPLAVKRLSYYIPVVRCDCRDLLRNSELIRSPESVLAHGRVILDG